MTSKETIDRWRAGTGRRITRGPENWTVTMERRYEFPAEAVWDAWTSPERLARWLGTVSGDLRPGGDVVLDMDPDTKVQCVITACDPPRRLAVLWRHPGEPTSAVELRLTPDGGGTVLTLEHSRLPRDRGIGYGYGWEDFLDRLGALLTDDDPGSVSWAESEQVLRPLWDVAPVTTGSNGS